MFKQYLILFRFFLFAFTPMLTVKAETVPKVEDSYVTTEDIVSDIVFPTIDKRVIKEYGGDSLFHWN
jgi:hypothetical protein